MKRINTIKYILCNSFLWLILSLTLFSSCAKDEVTPNVKPVRTVLFYLGRDNNLSGSNEEKIASILEGWNGQNGNLVIYQDRTGEKPRLMEVYRENGLNRTKTIAEYPEENSASAAVFSRTLREIQTRYTTDSYGLVVFSHASGWLPANTLTSVKSVITDGDSEMELRDFAAAIPDGMLDFIVFEACFMAGIEVAYELKDKAGYILASSAEILSPGFKEVYPHAVNDLFKLQADLTGFAQKAFNWVNGKSGVYRSGTISLIKTSGLNTLASWLRSNTTGEQPTDIHGIQHFDRYSYRIFFDFEDYYSKLVETEEKRQVLAGLIGDCIVYKAATPSFMLPYNGFEIKRHSGLTSYIMQAEFPHLNGEYQKLSWYKDVFTD